MTWEDKTIERTLQSNQRLIDAGFLIPGDNRRSSAQSYAILRVALRNALFRVTKSNTEFCPSSLFREIERGDIDVGDVTTILTAMLKRLQDEAWSEGVEGTCKRVYGLSQNDTDRITGMLSSAG